MKANYCGLYPASEVLPDENNNCSLCGSKLNKFGECLYNEKIDLSAMALAGFMAKASKLDTTKYTSYGGFNAKKHKATCDKNRRKRKNKK